MATTTVATSDTITVCSVGCDESSIIAAVDRAVDGDVIQLQAETYLEGAVIAISGKAITLRGAVDAEGRPASIISGNDSHRVLDLRDATQAGEAAFENLVIHKGNENRNAGGMYIERASPTLVNCAFKSNYSRNGGGIWMGYGTPVLTDCSFEDNEAIYGGAIYNKVADSVLTNCTFFRNTATLDAGAFLSLYSSPNLDTCMFKYNVSKLGGALCSGESFPSLESCGFTMNRAIEGGGAIYDYCSVTTISNSVVCGNTVGEIGQDIATDTNQIEDDGCEQYVDAGGNCIFATCWNCDIDRDGLTDKEEDEIGTDPCDPDTDGDTEKDGTDPCPLDPTDSCVNICNFTAGAPVSNPAQNPDGTWTYWAGNNMQWEIQEAIDDCSPGDIIVVRCGDYVDSLVIDKPNITIRPFLSANGEWEPVSFWNPTQGPQAQNGWAMYIGPDTDNTYIGRPRTYRQLESGYVSPTTIVPGEYFADPGVAAIEVTEVSGACFTFWSRSIDNTCILSDNGKATLENCTFTSLNGFGAGAMLLGDSNATAFVDCTFENLFANGTTLRSDVPGLDMPNYCISIFGGTGGTMDYLFSNCQISNNRGETIVYQESGRGHWHGTSFESNLSDLNYSGVVTLLYCNPTFANCSFVENSSGYGTIFYDGTGVSSLDGLRFSESEFRDNQTIDGQWGGVIWAQDDMSNAGGATKVMFDDCIIDGNNDNNGVDQEDFVTPWFPTYRQGGYNRNATPLDLVEQDNVICNPSADLNGDGVVNGNDLGLMFSLWGTDGNL